MDHTSSMEEAQRGVGFALDPLTKLAQHVISKNDLQAIHQLSTNKHTEDMSPFPSGQCPKGNNSIEKVVSEDNIAANLSLPLKRESLNYLRQGLGMMEHIP
ncbi:hypothetical protein Tco_0564179 [Tanacetum coccineum]